MRFGTPISSICYTEHHLSNYFKMDALRDWFELLWPGGFRIWVLSSSGSWKLPIFTRLWYIKRAASAFSDWGGLGRWLAWESWTKKGWALFLIGFWAGASLVFLTGSGAF